MRIVVGIDPPASARAGADLCGIVAAGLSEEGFVYVLADESSGGLAPDGWAQKAIALYRRLKADALIAEVNQGGDMVSAVLRQVDRSVPVREVRATRGKYLRAEPVAALYAQGKVKHVDPPLAALEDEMCDFGLGGLSTGASPDRLDALVWAVTALTSRGWEGPRIRSFDWDPTARPWGVGVAALSLSLAPRAGRGCLAGCAGRGPRTPCVPRHHAYINYYCDSNGLPWIYLIYRPADHADAAARVLLSRRGWGANLSNGSAKGTHRSAWAR